jgi:hypothetical protein
MKTTLKMLAPERLENNERWNDHRGKSQQRTYPNALFRRRCVSTCGCFADKRNSVIVPKKKVRYEIQMLYYKRN